MKEFHGLTGTRLYNRWKQIKRRTTKPKSINFKNYGGRGIFMCPEWLNSFTAFRDYLGEPPTPKHTIERIDNNKGYEPGNVRWATYAEQIANQRNRKSKYGLPGVRCTKTTFWSMIAINGERKYLGSFETAEAAHEAYKKAKENHVLSLKAVSAKIS